MLLTISIHSLARGRTRSGISGRKLVDISIHSLARGRTQKRLTEALAVAFQSTPSQEGEQISDCCCNVEKIFQSTPSQEGEQFSVDFLHAALDFNPLPRKRENGIKSIKTDKTDKHFNPLPRKRENAATSSEATEEAISIHSLARGRTILLIRCQVVAAFQSTPSQEGEQKAV